MNDLTTIDPVEQQRLKEYMGMAANNVADRVSLVKINVDHEDDNGKEIPPGSIYLKDEDTLVYAKTFKFRVLGHHFQYIEYDPEQNKAVCRTLINKSFNEDFLDTRGTMKCGMMKAKSKMEPYEAERFKNVTCFRQLRGLISYEGVDADGNSHTVSNKPAIMLCKGSNFMPFDEEVVKKLPRKSAAWDYWLDVSLERKKKGSVTYYVMHFKFDPSNAQLLDPKTAESVSVFAKMVDSDNKRILEQHHEAIRKRNEGSYEVAEGDDLEADFE